MRKALLLLGVACFGCAVPSVWRGFKPESGTAIVGRVIDPSGQPVQGAQVSTRPETDTEFSDDRGYFAIQWRRIPAGQGRPSSTQAIPPGEYEVIVDKPLFKPHAPIHIRFGGKVLVLQDVVLVPEPIDLDIRGFRPAKSDPTLPGDASAPKRE